MDCPRVPPTFVDNVLRWLSRREISLGSENLSFRFPEVSIRSQWFNNLLRQSSKVLRVLELSLEPTDQNVAEEGDNAAFEATCE